MHQPKFAQVCLFFITTLTYYNTMAKRAWYIVSMDVFHRLTVLSILGVSGEYRRRPWRKICGFVIG